MKCHGEGEVFRQGPGGPRKRQEHAEDDSHPEDTPDVVVAPPGQLRVGVDVSSGNSNL